MTRTIEPSLKLISEYLTIRTDELFVIPEYQRRYSWTVLECDKLWQDIESYIDSGTVNESGRKEPYFFGTIIADCSEPNQISLIDGQQRTTTFILLLKALLNRLNEKLEILDADEDSRKLKVAIESRRNRVLDILYKTNDDTRLDLMEDWNKARGVSVLESRSINELEDFKRDLQTIIESPDFVTAEAFCHRIPRRQKDNKYTNFFRNFKFFYEKLGEYDSTQINLFAKTFLGECQIIEIRSWNTEQAITMFNSLNSTGMPLSDSDIIAAQLYSNAVEEREIFIAKWEEITKLADNLSARKIANIDSLLQQLMYIQRAEQKEYVREGAQPDVTTPGLRRYYTIKNKEMLKHPLDVCGRIEKIAKIWDFVSEKTAVKLLLKFNENAKLYLISFLNRFPSGNLEEAPIVEMAECLMKLFAVLEIVDAGYSSARFKTFLFGENVKLVDLGVSIEEIKRDFHEHISRVWDPEEIQASLSEYDKNILVFLNEYLYAKKHGKNFSFAESVNIEHIMPGSGHNLDSIRQDAGIDSREEFVSLVNKLGNKILLEEDINKSIGNEWFKTKKQKSVKDKRGYKDSSYELAHALTEYSSETWTKTDIIRATERAVQRISDFIFSE